MSSYSFWSSETHGLMKLFHLCSLVSIADKENGVGLVFFLHHSSSVSRDWEEETGPSFLRIPQVQGIWRQWICEGLSASFSTYCKNAPVMKRRKEKRKGGKTPTDTPKTVVILNFAASWMLSSEIALVPRLWHDPLTLWCKTSLFSACFWWNLESLSSSPILRSLQSLLSLCWNTTFWNWRDLKDF